MSKANYEALGKELVEILTARGLGAVPKRDLDALLLYLLEKHLGWAKWSNQQLSVKLRLPVPKVKALRYEGALRFTEDLDAEFHLRFRRLLRQAHFETKKSEVQFIIEDYATKFVLEEYLKKQGKLADWSFNPEGVRVPAGTLVKLVATQFVERDREAAIARLGIQDPEGLEATIENVFSEVVTAARESQAGKLVNVFAKLAPGVAKAKKLTDLIFAEA